MDSDSEDPFDTLLRQLFPFLLSLLDDFLIIGLSRLGCNLPWLEWLSPIVMTGTGIYMVIQFCRSPYGAKIAERWQSFRQELEAIEI